VHCCVQYSKQDSRKIFFLEVTGKELWESGNARAALQCIHSTAEAKRSHEEPYKDDGQLKLATERAETLSLEILHITISIIVNDPLWQYFPNSYPVEIQYEIISVPQIRLTTCQYY
jgi:hypothetical protein